MMSVIKDNVILYFMVLNLLASLYLIVNQHILVGIFVTIITAIIVTMQYKQSKENKIKNDDIDLKHIVGLVPYMPIHTTITDIYNNQIISNVPHREILETIDINDIFKNPDSANIRLFRNGEKIIKVKTNNKAKYYCTINNEINDKNGNIIGYIESEFDLTNIIEYQQQLPERNKTLEFLEARLEKQIDDETKDKFDNKRDFQDILDNNNDGILIFSYNTKENRVLGFIYSNFVARNLIQQQGLELRNVDIYDLFHSSEKDRVEKILRNMISNKPILFETLMMFNNIIVPVEINAHLCRTYNKDAVYLSIRDIRLRKELEAKRDKNRLISIKDNKLDFLIQTLSIIFTKITHQTKKITEQITILNNNFNLNNETKEILQSSKNIDQTIKDMISIYTPTNIKSYINIKNLVESIKDKIFFKEIINNTEIQIMQKGDIKDIYCDEDALKYVILSIINFSLENININKGTNFYGKINITLQELNNNYILLSIEDNAGGIDNDTLSRIFDIFYQTKISSSGLELPTCKAIVEEVLLGHMQISNIDNGSKIDIQISK
ncbi:MAG: HAMP domain-containing histidine kinase [Helicobacteraceae bacterium]|nr:HAMP domain-containing histidine kinase [Helicobacteraceae bacterium]